jgi:transposase InsO family protein
MVIKMDDSRIDSLQLVNEFNNSNDSCSFKIEDKADAYNWIQKKLVQFSYITLCKKEKGLIRLYLQKITGYSQQQLTRLIAKYIKTGKVTLKPYIRFNPKIKYSKKDIDLIAKTDRLHNNPSGPSLVATLKRMLEVYKDKLFVNVALISVSYIYVLRSSYNYRQKSNYYVHTKPTVVPIGHREIPYANGIPGYIRIDSVHQGDKDNEKGIYHVNAVDITTQYEIIFAVPQISEKYMAPVIEAIINAFPFNIFAFHSDNGSEYINHNVADILNRLLVKRQTKSRPRHSNDNALVESKNGSIIRKNIGYSFISQDKYQCVNEFYKIFNEYLNYHRPCSFYTEETNEKGKIKKVYKHEDYMTPYSKLISIENYEATLKPGISKESLKVIANRYTDNEFAQIVQKAKTKMFKEVSIPKKILEL